MNTPEQQTEAADGQSQLTVELGAFFWKPDTGPWASGHVCYAGKWPVGKVAWTSRGKGDTEHQGAFMKLPGLKECIGYFATEDEARARVERAARYWIDNLNTPN
jgi:hypothetical protein